MTASRTCVLKLRNFKAPLNRAGLTLVEIMIALTMTLIVLGAMMSAFKYASEKMQLGRAVMEMANRLRTTEEMLRSDLANLTLDPRPYSESTSPNGFLEIVEGSINDSSSAASINNYIGDVDDSIGMTVRSPDGKKFRGVIGGTVTESTMAEVWYFPTWKEVNIDGVIDFEDSVRLHRRLLLIRPDAATLTGQTAAQVNNFVRNNDLSVRIISTNAGNTEFSIVPNTLADLAVRKNRFAHVIDAFAVHNFPNEFDWSGLALGRIKPAGGDILLTDVAAFDVRVYSPNATVENAGSVLVEPGDVGYNDNALPLPTTHAIGAFVDLGYAAGTTEAAWFAQNGASQSQLSGGSANVFDTWTTFYEHDGLDQDGDSLIDEGTNGLNDPVTGGTPAPDDDAERETRPPYPFPVRGIKITMRLIEKTTQQVHQSSIIQSYVPE